jgi:hypothetical protein
MARLISVGFEEAPPLPQTKVRRRPVRIVRGRKMWGVIWRHNGKQYVPYCEQNHVLTLVCLPCAAAKKKRRT